MSFVPPVYKTGSVLMFTQALPPLPPGYSIAPTGIPSYLLTKEEAANNYYDKTTSDGRYINESGDYFPGEIFMVPTSGGRFVGVRYETEVDIDLKTGFAWKNEDSTPIIIGWFSRKGLGVDSTLEIAIAKEDGSAPVVLSLKTDGSFTTTKTRSGAATASNEFLTATSGFKKGGDTITGGTYYFQAGKIYLQSLTDVEGSYRTVAILDFFADGVTDIINLQGNYITGSGVNPDSGTDLTAKTYVDTKDAERVDRNGDTIFEWLTYVPSVSFDPFNPPNDADRPYRLASIGYVDQGNSSSGFDAVVRDTPLTGEYSTVRAAMIAGKKKIKVMPGTFSATNFWPNGDILNMMNTEYLVEGSGIGSTIISGNSTFTLSSGYSLANIVIKNIDFFRDSGNVMNFGNPNNGLYECKFENCRFQGANPDIGFITYSTLTEENALTFEDCIFAFADVALYMNNTAVSTPFFKNVLKVKGCHFNGNGYGIYIKYRLGNITIEGNTFTLTIPSSNAIFVEATELTGSTDKISKHRIYDNIFVLDQDTCKCIYVSVPGTDNGTSGAHYFLRGNLFRAESGVTTPYSVHLTANTTLAGNNKLYFYVAGNEMYGFTVNSNTGINISGAATTIDSAIFLGATQITTLANLSKIADTNIVI